MRLGVMQVYAEAVEDLLAGRPVSMTACEVVGLLQPAVAGADDAITLIQRGTAARKGRMERSNFQARCHSAPAGAVMSRPSRK